MAEDPVHPGSSERQIGYKSMKFLRSITVTNAFEDGGKDGNIQSGWAWYTGI